MYVKFEIDCSKNLASIAVRFIRTDRRTDRRTDGSGDDNTLGALRGPRVKIGRVIMVRFPKFEVLHKPGYEIYSFNF